MVAALNRLSFMKDAGGARISLPAAFEFGNQLNITAGVPKYLTVPTGATHVIFACETNFYVKPGGVTPLTRPAGDLTDGTAWDINPEGYFLEKIGGAAITSLAVDIAVSGLVVAKFYKAR